MANNEKTNFLKCKGSDFIMQGLFIDDIMYSSLSVVGRGQSLLIQTVWV